MTRSNAEAACAKLRQAAIDCLIIKVVDETQAGWDTGGAVCMSRARWLLDDGLQIASLCPDRLIPPGLLGATVCDTVVEVLFQEPKAMLFNESYLKIGLLNLDLGIIGL